MTAPLRVCRVCGLEAYNKEELEKFKKRTGYPYNRLTICKKCNYRKLKKPKDPYLRKCRICGLEAKTKNDLELFTSHHRMPFGKNTVCKKCKVRIQTEKDNHTEELLEVYKKRHPEKKILCYFCGKEIKKLRGRSAKSLNNHSLDGNHNNWKPNNKVPTHKDCHGFFHSQDSNTAQYLHLWRKQQKKDLE